MSDKNPKQLLVEGYEDLTSVCYLIEAHIDWPTKNPPVWIEQAGGVEKILEGRYIPTMLKSSVVRTLGVMLDADFSTLETDSASRAVVSRYERIRTLCRDAFPALPSELPTTGLIAENDEGKRLGVWIMPDNTSAGYLETFLWYLVPGESQHIWSHAQSSTTVAKELGAPYHDVHVDKANLHAYLAWQNPPGQNYGIALSKKMLDPNSLMAAAFVKWFRDLYEL